MPAKRDLPDRICEWCGEPYSRGTRPSGKLEAPTHFLQRRFCSNPCKYAARVKGPNAQTSRYRAAKIVDPKFCVFCSSTERVAAHHIDGDPFNNDHGNLIAMCCSCHSIFHALARKLV